MKSTKNNTKAIEELTHKWKRAVADYQNLERRITEQQQDFVKFANAALVSQLLAVGDDLERANEHLNDEGLRLTVNRFKEVLKAEGVEEIEAEGKPFDPTLMECTDMTQGQDNTVVSVALKGYKLNDKVLRPAKVIVGKGDKHHG